MIAKLKYVWVEGEEGEAYITHPKKDQQAFREDLIKIRDIINKNNYHEDYGNAEFIPCPPSYFDLVIIYLEEFGYSVHYEYQPKEYYVDDDGKDRALSIEERVVNVNWELL